MRRLMNHLHRILCLAVVIACLLSHPTPSFAEECASPAGPRLEHHTDKPIDRTLKVRSKREESFMSNCVNLKTKARFEKLSLWYLWISITISALVGFAIIVGRFQSKLEHWIIVQKAELEKHFIASRDAALAVERLEAERENVRVLAALQMNRLWVEKRRNL